MREVHKLYMAELEIEVLREKNKKLKQEINQLKDLLDKHLNIKTTRMDKEQQKDYAIEIAEKVCNYYQIKYGQMMSKYRGEEVTLARQMISEEELLIKIASMNDIQRRILRSYHYLILDLYTLTEDFMLPINLLHF
jgi:chromosomal replication initiation ATPase DnaA